MHIPDHLLHGAVCPLSATLAAAGLMAAVHWASRSSNRPSTAAFGAVAALLFVGQLMNFPVMDGTSGHVLGGVLAASLLGTPFAVLAMALVVAVQALVFSDGGLAALGANVFNMAIIGAGAGGWLRSALGRRWATGLGQVCATAIAAWGAVMLAALMVSVELAFDGRVGFMQVAPAMLGVHALTGMAEAVATAAVVVLLPSGFRAEHGRLPVWPVAGIAAMLSLAPFATDLPDGLESAMSGLNAWHASNPAFAGLLPDYALPLVASPALSFASAGAAGALLSFGLAWMLLRFVRPSGDDVA